MKNGRFIGLLLCLTACMTGWSQPAKEARRVIERYAEGRKVPVKLSVSLDRQDGCDVFETSVKNGKLHINASSGVAACRGFYEYVKSQGRESPPGAGTVWYCPKNWRIWRRGPLYRLSGIIIISMW